MPVVAKLREEEAAPVADVGIVHPELVPVITERQRLAEIVRQRLETSKMAEPFLVAEPAETDGRCPAIVPEAQNRLREVGGLDRVVKGIAQRMDCGFGAIGAGLRAMHGHVLWGLAVGSGGWGRGEWRLGRMAIGGPTMGLGFIIATLRGPGQAAGHLHSRSDA